MTTEREREQADRRAYLENEKLLRVKAAENKRASTYLAMAEAASLEIGGRFKQVSPMTIVGVAPTPIYPTQPANSPAAIPWPNDPDPLGYSVEDMPVVGEPFEVDAAQRILHERLAAPPASGGADDGPVVLPSTVDFSAPPTSFQSPTVLPSVSVKRAVPEADGAARSSFRRRL